MPTAVPDIMSLVYSALAFVEVFVLIAAAAGALYFMARAIWRLVFPPKDALPVPKPEDLRHLKRAGQ